MECAAFLTPAGAAARLAVGGGQRKRASRCARRRARVGVCAASTPPPPTPGERDWQKHDDDEKTSARADEEEDVPLELIDGVLDNARIRPKIDLDANEYMLMWKLRRMLHEDDFKRIFDQKNRRIGDF